MTTAAKTATPSIGGNLNEKEIDLIQRTFRGNEELLKSIRALFFGMPVTDNEKKVIRDTFSNPELLSIMWRRFCPSLDKETPIGQVQDVWLGVEQQVFGFPEGTIRQAVLYKHYAVEWTKTGLALLENPDGPGVNVEYSPISYRIDADPLAIHLLARNQYIRHVETQLSFLHVIASLPQEDSGKSAKEVINSSK